MHRVLTLALGFFFTASLCMAQISQGSFIQRGIATQEMRAGGLSAGHPSLPVGSKARVTSIINGKEIEVTITARIPPSTERIIDLSPSSAQALGLGSSGAVVVTSFHQPQRPPVAPELMPRPVNVPEPEIEPEPVIAEVILEPEIIVEGPEALDPVPAPPTPVNITIYNYITNPPAPEPQPQAQQGEIDYLAWLTLIAMEARAAHIARSAETAPPAAPAAAEAPPPPVAPAVPEAPPPSAVPPVMQAPPPPAVPAAMEAPPPAIPQAAANYPPLYDAPPVREVLIVPGLPNPNTNRLYQLQVGAYSSVETASRALRQLQAAGFDAVQEMTSSSMYRVYATGIPAAIVYDAAQRLGAMGFSQVWVRE